MAQKKKIVAVIQARMGSTRLPGKVMVEVAGKPVLEQVIERVNKSRLVDSVIVATTTNQEDDIVVKLCNRLSIKSFRGNEKDVLDRFYQCVKDDKIDVIVRITADCPLIDPDLIDRAVEYFLEKDCDYVSTAYPEPTFPDGLDVEVFPFRVLKKTWEEAKLPSEREHVTPYIWKNKNGEFKIDTIKSEKNLSDKRWTLDDEKDLQFIRTIYNALYKENLIFKTKDILDYLEKNPEIELINSDTVRNEGYLKSLKIDTEAE